MAKNKESLEKVVQICWWKLIILCLGLLIGGVLAVIVMRSLS
jgi:hypothetical protein